MKTMLIVFMLLVLFARCCQLFAVVDHLRNSGSFAVQSGSRERATRSARPAATPSAPAATATATNYLNLNLNFTLTQTRTHTQ